MPTLQRRYEIKVTGSGYIILEDDDLDLEQAEEQAIKQFYDESHRIEIEGTTSVDEWFYCDDCGEDRVDEDHECEEESEEESEEDQD